MKLVLKPATWGGQISSITILLAIVAWIAGCGPTPDPLAGWKASDKEFGAQLDKAIMADYENYIKTLSSLEKNIASFPYNQSFWENGDGQHAIQIKISMDGTHWKHVLIYDKSNKRIKSNKISGRKIFFVKIQRENEYDQKI